MKLVIIIPAYNEAKTIAQVIHSIPNNIPKISNLEIVVIDDGSSDHTSQVAKQAGATYVIRNKTNLGLARTFARGINFALAREADIIVNTDADMQYVQSEIPNLIEPIIIGQADMVIGNRQVKNLKFMKPGNKYGNLFGSWVLRKLTGTRVQDASSGFRAFSYEAALNLNILGNHTYTHETIIQAAHKKLAITEVPVSFCPRSQGQSRLINNLFSHIKKSILTIVRSILMYKPLKTLFYLGLVVATPGFILGLRFVYFYLKNQGGGKIQSLILASIFITLGFFTVILGLIGDVVAKNRILNERLLHEIKKRKNEKPSQ